MCGIIGIVAKGAVNQSLYDGLTILQHRGQDAAGIATYEDGRLFLRKADGLVRDVFHTRDMINLKGRMGIGHVRYPTAGAASTAEAQPFYVNSPYGIALAHNGNLTNSEQLKRELFEEGLRHINTDSDSEVLLNVFAHELQRFRKRRIGPEDIFRAITNLHQRCRGGYAAIAMITGVGILGFRDPYGIRPIVFGTRDTPQGPEYIIASESVAIDVLGYKLVRDIAPGEAVFVRKDGELHTKQCASEPRLTPCIFEHVYLARPDSIIDGISVHKARMRMGEALARKIKRDWGEHGIDVVIPIPDTSRTA
ncbi:MAG: amidophosphoribosyltransferase, partial [Gammaproteobacteria bacterium]